MELYSRVLYVTEVKLLIQIQVLELLDIKWNSHGNHQENI